MITTVYLAGSIVVSYLLFTMWNRVSVQMPSLIRLRPAVATLELIVWSFVSFLVVSRLLDLKYSYSFLETLALSVLFLLVIWFFVKDIVAGYVFKIRYNPLPGQSLSVSGHEGTIKQLTLSHLILDTTQGALRIPYSQITNAVLSIKSLTSSDSRYTVIVLEVDTALDQARVEQRIREVLAQSSWFLAFRPVTIKSQESGKLEVGFTLIDPNFLPQARFHLQDAVRELAKASTRPSLHKS